MQRSMVYEIFLHFNNRDKIPHPRHEYCSYLLVFTWRHSALETIWNSFFSVNVVNKRLLSGTQIYCTNLLLTHLSTSTYKAAIYC